MVTRNNQNTWLSVGSNSEMRMPAQPGFLTVLAAQRDNVTGAATVYTIVWGQEIYDKNADFDNTSTFTSPVTGRYYLGGTISYAALTVAGYARFLLTTSNRGYTTYIGNVTPSVAGALTVSFSVLGDMDAGDTATVAAITSAEAADTVDVVYTSASDPKTVFYSYLFC